MAGADEGQKKKKPARRKGKQAKKARKAKASRQPQKKGDGRRRASLISAIAHPLRRRILHLLHDWGKPASPAQISRELHVPLSAIVYHSAILRKLGALEPAGERQVRGAIEHFYSSTIKDDPPIEALLEETREVDEEG